MQNNQLFLNYQFLWKYVDVFMILRLLQYLQINCIKLLVLLRKNRQLKLPFRGLQTLVKGLQENLELKTLFIGIGIKVFLRLILFSRGCLDYGLV
jgi:hypothetical protein